jgi:hypothetical protein
MPGSRFKPISLDTCAVTNRPSRIRRAFDEGPALVVECSDDEGPMIGLGGISSVWVE